MFSPLQSLGQSLLQVGGGCWEGELDCDAAAVVEDGGEVISFRGGQDGQLVVWLTCSRHTGASDHVPETSVFVSWLEKPGLRLGSKIIPGSVFTGFNTFRKETNSILLNVHDNKTKRIPALKHLFFAPCEENTDVAHNKTLSGHTQQLFVQVRFNTAFRYLQPPSELTSQPLTWLQDKGKEKSIHPSSLLLVLKGH